MPDPSAALTYGALGAMASATLTVGGILLAAVRKVWPVWTRVEQFLEDWTGTPDRPGFPGVPGVPARLEAVERGQEEMAASLATLAAAQEQKAAAIQDLAARYDGLERRMDVHHPDITPRSA